MKKHFKFLLINFILNFLIFTTSSYSQWEQCNGPYGGIVNALAISGSNIFAGTYNGVFLSTNNGANWTPTSLNNKYVHSLAISGSNIFAGTQSSGVYLSTNNGASWTQTSLNNRTVRSLAISGSNIFAGTDSNGVYLSTNNGANWTQINDGFNPVPTVSSLAIGNNYIFAGTYGNSVWRRSYPITEAENTSSDLLSDYELYQNYPNPFNPSTSIQYAVGNRQFVQLKVYDILGNEVATLVNEEKEPGYYEVYFNVGQTISLSSGVYFYRLQAGDFVETKKMILLR
jgi:hypothetical protein